MWPCCQRVHLTGIRHPQAQCLVGNICRMSCVWQTSQARLPQSEALGVESSALLPSHPQLLHVFFHTGLKRAPPFPPPSVLSPHGDPKLFHLFPGFSAAVIPGSILIHPFHRLLRLGQIHLPSCLGSSCPLRLIGARCLPLHTFSMSTRQPPSSLRHLLISSHPL